jgi:hypothetical protein
LLPLLQHPSVIVTVVLAAGAATILAVVVASAIVVAAGAITAWARIGFSALCTSIMPEKRKRIRKLQTHLFSHPQLAHQDVPIGSYWHWLLSSELLLLWLLVPLTNIKKGFVKVREVQGWKTHEERPGIEVR